MKKRIALVMALAMLAVGFTACGNATEDSVAPATETVTETEETTEETAEESTEDPYIEDASIIGTYVCDRAKLDITSNDARSFLITIIWGSSADTTAEWDAVAHLDKEHVLHYEACRMQGVTYDAEGNAVDTKIEYTDGTGTFEFTDKGVLWHDDKEDAGKDMLFVRSELAEEETAAETEAAETEAAEETGAEDETNPPLVGIFEGTYVEKTAGRGVIEIINNMNDTYTVKVHWADSAAVSNDWEFSGEFSGKQVLDYTDCTKTRTVYAEDGTPTVDENGDQTPIVMYTNGTGFLKMTDEALFWTDNMEHVADDAEFIKQ